MFYIKVEYVMEGSFVRLGTNRESANITEEKCERKFPPKKTNKPKTPKHFNSHINTTDLFFSRMCVCVCVATDLAPSAI